MIQLAEHVAEILGIGPGTRVFEVDCSRGEFLFAFYQNGYIVGGIDGDPDAITTAIAAMPDGLFQIGAASYMRGVLARMFAKATHAIALVGVPDERRQWMLHALAEVGANAIQIEDAKHAANARDTFNVFARV